MAEYALPVIPDQDRTARTKVSDAAPLPVYVAGGVLSAGNYETVAASQTDQSMGASGATGDYLLQVVIIPATTSPGAVSIKDGGGSSITIFTGGASSVANLIPFTVAISARSTAGAWKITTGSNVSAIGVGNFT